MTFKRSSFLAIVVVAIFALLGSGLAGALWLRPKVVPLFEAKIAEPIRESGRLNSDRLSELTIEVRRMANALEDARKADATLANSEVLRNTLLSGLLHYRARHDLRISRPEDVEGLVWYKKGVNPPAVGLDFVSDEEDTYARVKLEGETLWNDSNHYAPGAGWLNLLLVAYFKDTLGGPINDISYARVTYEIRLRDRPPRTGPI